LAFSSLLDDLGSARTDEARLHKDVRDLAIDDSVQLSRSQSVLQISIPGLQVEGNTVILTQGNRKFILHKHS